MPKLQSLEQANADNRDFWYRGDREEWLIAAVTHRDADLITESNFAVLQQRLSGESENTWAVEDFNHRAIGYGSWLLVQPGTGAARIAQEAADQLEDYPLLDEKDYSEREYAEYLATITEALRRYIWRFAHAHYDYVESVGEIAPMVYRLCENGGCEQGDEIGYSGVVDFWPSDRVLWAGLLEYRHSLKTA